MVLLAASICTRGGKPVLSRQFREMSRSRVEGLLSSFPKLLSSGSQHTTIETEHVRYVYQPLEDLYMILITNKSSNILQDIDTLHLFARVVSDLCRSLDERDILRNSFELLGAFDEIVSLGYRENVNLPQVRTILEMESNEEKIQEIIERNKELEAKEELKRRAKQLEMQRRDATRRGQAGAGYGNMGAGGYSGVSRSGYDSPTSSAPVVRDTGATAAPAPRPFKGKGLQLGKKSKQADLLGDLGASQPSTPAIESASEAQPLVSQPRQATAAAPAAVVRSQPAGPNPLDSLPPVEQKAVHVVVKERVSLTGDRDGSVSSIEIKGDLELRISDAAKAKVRLQISEAPSSSLFASAGEVQYKTHPHVDKNAWSSSKVISLKDPNKPFPVNQNLGVLRWRMVSKDQTVVPLTISCWPSASGDGTGEVNVEFELESGHDLTLSNVVIAIPVPEGSGPTVSGEAAIGSFSVDEAQNLLLWTIDEIDSSNSTGSLEFTVSEGADSADVFFPINVNFVSEKTLSRLSVASITSAETNASVDWSQQTVLFAEGYQVA